MNNQNVQGHNVGRITPAGQVDEFQVCDFCFPTDIVQGSDRVLYFTKNDASLGRITTDGTVLPDIPATFSPNGNGLDAHGDDIWSPTSTTAAYGVTTSPPKPSPSSRRQTQFHWTSP